MIDPVEKSYNLKFCIEFTFKCPKDWCLVNFRRKKVTSFKVSLLPEFLSEFFEPFDLSHCSESKLFKTFKKLTVKIGVPK